MKELLSPAGNMECLKAAIQNGANAVYLGGKHFGARAFAGNFSNEELKEATNYCHLYGVRIYITVNTIVYQDEVGEFIEYIDYLNSIGVDALIMQDIGMITLVKSRYPSFEIHASTQMHNQNNDNIKLLKSLGVKRLVLDRELSLEEINDLDDDIEKEVFIHGALCNCYSGCCLFSSLNGGRSGNRGECVQSCRMPFKLIKNGKYIQTDSKFLLSTKELNTTQGIKRLVSSNITSFKIEGRMKSPAYVGYVTRIYRKLIDSAIRGEEYSLSEEEKDNLLILFNRDFTSGYLFNDHIMNIKSSNHQGLEIGKVIEVNSGKIKIRLTKPLYQEDGIRFKNSGLGMIVNMLYNDKDLLTNKALPDDIIYLDNKIGLKEKDIVVKTSSTFLEKEILAINNRKIPIDINITEDKNKLYIEISDGINKVNGSIDIQKSINRPTSPKEIEEKISKLGNTPYNINNITINIPKNIFVSMSKLNELRRILIDKLTTAKIEVHHHKISDNHIEFTEEKIDKLEITALARNKEQVEVLLREKIDKIYVDEELYNIYKDYSNIYLRLPRVNKNYPNNIKNILVTDLGAVNHYKSTDTNIISDYYLNIVNNYSIKYLLDNNVKRVTLSPEVDYNNINNLIKDKLELIIYGRLELMITKSCPVKELKLCPCSKEDIYYLEDKSNKKYPIIHNKCLTHIMHYKNINYLDNISYYKGIGIRSFRLELFDEEETQILDLINRIKGKNQKLFPF